MGELISEVKVMYEEIKACTWPMSLPSIVLNDDFVNRNELPLCEILPFECHCCQYMDII